jgi:hypothetical protein
MTDTTHNAPTASQDAPGSHRTTPGDCPGRPQQYPVLYLSAQA